MDPYNSTSTIAVAAASGVINYTQLDISLGTAKDGAILVGLCIPGIIGFLLWVCFFLYRHALCYDK